MFKFYVFVFAFSLFSFSVLGQKTKGVLVFKNGETKKGLVKLSGSNSVKFRAKKKEKAVKYDFSTLEYAKIYIGEEAKIYKYVAVVNKETPIILEELIVGKVTLYNLHTQGYSSGFSPMAGGGAPMYTGGASYSINNLYVLKEGEDKASHLGSDHLFSKNFKKAASAFFKDCDSLVQKIQNKEFKKKEIKEIVEFYNDHCQ